jgi:CheY-like chemotaxis protein
MASVGALAAGVAHEINNPLAAVLSNLELAEADLDGVEDGGPMGELPTLVREARQASDRIRQISDTGVGIPPDVMRRLGTPFFTTKAAGVGTGLGLSICRRILSSMGGALEIESEEGHGSTFSVLIPVVTGTEESAPPGASLVVPPSRPGRVLVIDDETLVTSAVARVLSEDQHEVVVVENAHHALDLIQSGAHFDLILCDLMMPQVTGMDFHARVKRAFPRLTDSIVFLTGGAFTPSAREFLESVPNARIEKPFVARELRNIVNRHVR